MTKRLTALILAVILCIGMIPASAFAEETPEIVTEDVITEMDEALPEPAEDEVVEEAPSESELEGGTEEAPEPDPSVEPTEESAVEITDEPQEDIPAVRINPGSSRMARSIGERGKLRILYYTMPSDVTVSTQTMGELCGTPAHSIILSDGKTQKAAYCLNHEKGTIEGNGYTWETAEQSGQSDVIGTIIALGFQYVGQPTGNPPTPWGRGDSNDKWLVTQLLVWAATKGHITMGKNHLVNFEAAVDSDMEKVAPYTYNPSSFLAYYRQLKKKVIDSRKIPSFASYPSENGLSATEKKVINLKWDGEKYSATVTDKNGVLDNFNFSDTIPGVTVENEGSNTMFVASTEEIPEARTSTTVVYRPQGGRNALACWRTNNHDTSQQDFAVYTDGYDPVNAVITVATSGVPTGEAELIKTSEDGIVDGLTFEITGSDGKSYTKTTSGGGRIDLSGIPIYEEIPVLDEDGNPMQDELTGDDLVTKGDQITYTAREINVPIRYVIPRSQSFQLTEGQETSISFENRLKKWRVTVTKTDRETGSTAQGDATLTGAVYGIYHNGVLQDTYTTDSSGKFTSKYYVCGTGWTMKEITPSEGYLLNTETVKVGMAPGETTIEYNSTSAGVREQVIKGKIGITKHTDDGSTQIETPESGAEFQVYLSAFGSYNAAKPAERDTITIGENGYGETKLLPYGMYTVHQTKGWEGKEKVPDFQVFIAEDGKTYSFIINNRVFEALIEIVKKDAETGRVIPASGIGFKIKDLTSGKWVSQHINYPTPMDISIFYTDVTGRLMLPAALTYGSYELYEQQSAYGYVISKDPIPFTVDGTAKQITVEMGNTPQKGQISIEKTGEIFSSVKEQGGRYVPVYKVTGLKGAVYALYAEEDIRTPDGTLRYAEGELIEKVETGADGKAKFPKVYLGKYRVQEVTAPHGFVLDSTVYHVEFTYGGQEIALLTETLDCYDQRQKVEISLEKALEQDEMFQIGMNEEFSNVRFGLFARDGLTAADGKRIPKDGLLEEISLTEAHTGKFTAYVPLGSYYVQELSTDEHYLLSDEKYPVTFEYEGQKKALIKLEVDDGNPIENALKRGRVQGLKSDGNGKLLFGAVFGLFAPDTEKFTEETAILTATSDENGIFSFEDIPFGKWLIRELKAPSGYLLDSASHEVEITEDGETIKLELVNKPVPHIPAPKLGSIVGEKQDTNGKPLAGVVFGLFPEGTTDFSADNAFATVKTDEAGKFLFKDVAYGRWLVVELETLPGYVLLKDPVEVEIAGDGQEIHLDPIQNDHTKVEISKQDMTTGKELLGAKLQLFDKDGKLVEEWTSTDKPHLIEKLPAGEYRLHEETAPEGYTVAEDVTFTVEETGEIQKVVMIDAPKVDVPNTGEDNTLKWVSGLFFFSLAGVVVLLQVLRRIRRKERKGE